MIFSILIFLNLVKYSVCGSGDSYGYNGEWKSIEYDDYDFDDYSYDYSHEYVNDGNSVLVQSRARKPKGLCYNPGKIDKYNNFPEFFLADNKNVILGIIKSETDGVLNVQGMG